MEAPAHFTGALSPLGRRWRRAIDVTLHRFGLSEAFAAPLIYLGRSGGGITQSELADLIGIGGASLVRLLDKLVATGLIDRREDPEDKRVRRLHLTEQGTALVESIEEAVNETRAIALAGVDPADIETCLRVFRQMSEALAAMETPAHRIDDHARSAETHE